MPKELAYIEGFPKGSWANASQNAVPEGYAVYTENVDPKFKSLVPARKATAKANAADLDAEVLRCTNFDGVKVWGWKASNRALRAYDVATDALGSALTTPANQTLASIQNINRELYLPLYDSTSKVASDAYWAGLISYGQFNTAAAPTTYVLDKAKCDPYYYKADSQYPSAAARFYRDIITPANTNVANATTSDVFAVVKPPEIADFSNAREDGFFKKNNSYFWAVSFVYDGYQESPLIKYALLGGLGSPNRITFFGSLGNRASNYSSVKLFISINIGAATAISKRITGVNLYRAEAPGETPVYDSPTGPASKYRFVKSFSIRNGAFSPELIQSGGSATAQTTVRFTDYLNVVPSYTNYPLNSGTVYRLEFVDVGFEGATYEENTGVYDTLEQNWVNYKLSAFANGYHFVGQCSGAPTLLSGNSSAFIFRSVPNTPAVFNIAKDFLQLSDVPTALISWNGRLYAFSETKFIRINPEAMFIEEEIQGFGAAGDSTSTGTPGISRLVCATPYGLFFADLNNIYMYDGQRIRTIGDAIVRNAYAGNLSWFGETNPTRRRQATMVFDPNSQRVLIFFKSLSGADTQQYYLSFDPVRDRWDFGKPAAWTAASVKASDFDSQGRLYVSLSDTDWGAAETLNTMWTGDDEAITLVTPAYDFGSLRQTKWFYDVVVKNTGPLATAPSIEYRGEETSSWTNPAVTNNAPLFRIDLAGLLARLLQLRITIAAPVSGNGRNGIETLSIQFRRKVMRE